jgi:hypothetical protein
MKQLRSLLADNATGTGRALAERLLLGAVSVLQSAKLHEEIASSVRVTPTESPPASLPKTHVFAPHSKLARVAPRRKRAGGAPASLVRMRRAEQQQFRAGLLGHPGPAPAPEPTSETKADAKKQPSATQHQPSTRAATSAEARTLHLIKQYSTVLDGDSDSDSGYVSSGNDADFVPDSADTLPDDHLFADGMDDDPHL